MEDLGQFDRSTAHKAKLSELRAFKSSGTIAKQRNRFVGALFDGDCDSFEAHLRRVVNVATLQEPWPTRRIELGRTLDVSGTSRRLRVCLL